jgi:hypothetical protein
MALISIFQTNPRAFDQLNIEQVVSMAGDGQLRDGSECSDELRQYLGQIATGRIAKYVEHCLNSSFTKSGIVLQDLVNELGRRLDYDVTDGRYQGVAGGIGFDGIWTAQEGQSHVVEVKTTDTYRLSLETLATYRMRLTAAKQLTMNSSILIVVGRQDTGELEAQIRGSRHAWDVRVISVEALIKLVQLKENSDAPETGLKIRSLLVPVEYTRLDRMVDVMFTTASDVESSPLTQAPAFSLDRAESVDGRVEVRAAKGTFQFTDPSLLQATRERIVDAVSQRENVSLVRKSRALYWNSQHDVRIACSISKRHNAGTPYWYAFHPAWSQFLEESARSFFVLGCMDRGEAYAIPNSTLRPLLPYLNTTTKDGGTYWHIHLAERNGGVELLVPKRGDNLSLRALALPIAGLPLEQ